METVAVVNFRTLANGSYKYMNGLRRGYWRVLVVKDETGPKRIDSPNVVRVYTTGEGIEGVTERSAYCINAQRELCAHIADAYNTGKYARLYDAVEAVQVAQ